VDCTVFAPARVVRKQAGLLQVFLHAPEDQKQAKAAAGKFDPESKERGHRTLVLDAPRGLSEIGFQTCVSQPHLQYRFEHCSTEQWSRRSGSGANSGRCVNLRKCNRELGGAGGGVDGLEGREAFEGSERVEGLDDFFGAGQNGDEVGLGTGAGSLAGFEPGRQRGGRDRGVFPEGG
jgi:hypothetical protein